MFVVNVSPNCIAGRIIIHSITMTVQNNNSSTRIVSSTGGRRENKFSSNKLLHFLFCLLFVLSLLRLLTSISLFGQKIHNTQHWPILFKRFFSLQIFFTARLLRFWMKFSHLTSTRNNRQNKTENFVFFSLYVFQVFATNKFRFKLS